MTALKPLEGRKVRGVASERYPLNEICAQPECTEPTKDPHHIWPRGTIHSDSWFVTIEPNIWTNPVPHVTGLCRAHHDDVEDHRAWIKLEDDDFVWYDRYPGEFGKDFEPRMGEEWVKLGPLNPQPGSKEGKPKRKRFKGEARRQRQTVTMRVPKDADEDGAGILDDLHEQVEKKLGNEPPRPLYYSTIDAFNFLLANIDTTDV